MKLAINPLVQELLDRMVESDHLDLTQLYRLGKSLDLPDEIEATEEGQPRMVSVLPILQKVLDSDGIKFGGEDSNYMEIINANVYFCVDYWWPFFYTVNKWRATHTTAALPADSVERLGVLCKIIEHSNNGTDIDMAQIRATLRELSIPDKLAAYLVGEGYEDNEPNADVRIDICLAHMANNPSTSLAEDNTLVFHSGNCHYRLLNIPNELAKVGRAFAARRKRLYIPCVSAQA